MAYEMASRDHYRLDVLNKQAAKLQQVDAELGQVERLLKMGETGTTGNCPSCGALQARGAVFCWQCGTEIKPPTDAKPKAAAEAEAEELAVNPAAPCSGCGSALDADQRYCVECGTRVGAPLALPYAASARAGGGREGERPPPPPAPRRPSGGFLSALPMPLQAADDLRRPGARASASWPAPP